VVLTATLLFDWRDERPTVVLVGHLDTVPAHPNPAFAVACEMLATFLRQVR
jgi:acetylornithine deacetylase/succinyl-diaminopimelate desuccinylase-like protein